MGDTTVMVLLGCNWQGNCATRILGIGGYASQFQELALAAAAFFESLRLSAFAFADSGEHPVSMAAAAPHIVRAASFFRFTKLFGIFSSRIGPTLIPAPRVIVHKPKKRVQLREFPFQL